MATEQRELQVIAGGAAALPTLKVSNEQKLTAIRDTVAKGATDAEFTMLMHLANTYQLDPFLKEIWFIKYGTTPTIMVSRDGLRNYSQRQDDFEGLVSQEVREGDTFKYNPITGEIHHETGDGSGPITKAYAIVYRKDKKPHIELVDFNEYFNSLSAKNGVWKSHPSAMIKKVVEVLALKKCYTITGLYAPEEMGLREADEPIDITPSHETAAPSQTKEESDSGNNYEDRVAAIKELAAFAEHLGIDGNVLRAYGQSLFGKSDPRKWSVEDCQKVRQTMEAEFTQSAKTESDNQVDQQGDLFDQKMPWEEESVSADDTGLPNPDELPF